MAPTAIRPGIPSRPFGSIQDPTFQRNQRLRFCLSANTIAAKARGNTMPSCATSIRNPPRTARFRNGQCLAHETRTASLVRRRFDPDPDTRCRPTHNIPTGFPQVAATPEGALFPSCDPQHFRPGRPESQSGHGRQPPQQAQAKAGPRTALWPDPSLQARANRAEPHRKPGDVA